MTNSSAIRVSCDPLVLAAKQRGRDPSGRGVSGLRRQRRNPLSVSRIQRKPALALRRRRESIVTTNSLPMSYAVKIVGLIAVESDKARNQRKVSADVRRQGTGVNERVRPTQEPEVEVL